MKLFHNIPINYSTPVSYVFRVVRFLLFCMTQEEVEFWFEFSSHKTLKKKEGINGIL